jgi:hypothetical protein
MRGIGSKVHEIMNEHCSTLQSSLYGIEKQYSGRGEKKTQGVS